MTKIRDSENLDNIHSNNEDEGKDYPGEGNTIQLLDKHVKFLGGLPTYLSYGGGRSNTYHCACSGTTKEWRKGIHTDNLPKGTRCSGNFGELALLLDHCRDKNDVYHLGSEEYVRTLQGVVQWPTPGTGYGAG